MFNLPNDRNDPITICSWRLANQTFYESSDKRPFGSFAAVWGGIEVRIKVDTDALRETAAELDELLEKMSDGINIIKTILYDIDGDWQGESQKAFAMRIFEMGSGFLDIESSLRKLSEELRFQADEFEGAENEASSLVAF